MISVTIEYGHEFLGEKKMEVWPKDGLKGVLLGNVKNMDDGWYVVTAQDTDTGDVLSKQAFWRFRLELRTYDMTHINTEDIIGEEYG